MQIIKVTSSNQQQLIPQIEELEHTAAYPLGDDFFAIDHGPSYFAFFNRLGALYYYCAVDKQQVVGVGAGILRQIKQLDSQKYKRAWYLCDLKIRPDYRGQHLPLRILRRAFLFNYLRCPRGYAISMDPADGRNNRVVTLLNRFRLAPLTFGAKLCFFTLNYEDMMRHLKLIEHYRGPVRFRSTDICKKLILQSTGAPLKLLHLEYRNNHPEIDLFDEPRPDFTHMLCATEHDPLTHALADAGIKHNSTASIVHHRMNGWDWSFILSSDI